MDNFPNSDGKLVMTCTPLRISFAGGGTDIDEFYLREYGAVLSTAINKYVYVTVKQHGHLFQEQYRLNYAETENVNTLDEIKNDIARECLRLVPVDPPIYISTVGDVPAASGLGSSSSFAVGLLKALHALRGERVSPAQLAQEAVHVEVNILKHPIGKQDQYAAAYGGFNMIRFMTDGSVNLEQHSSMTTNIGEIFSHAQIFWTGITRDSGSVLTEQKQRTNENLNSLVALRDQAEDLNRLIRNGIEIKELGGIMNEGWRLKRDLASKITNSDIDAWYDKVISAGAYGGKLCGAGGGGFLLFLTPPDKRKAVSAALSHLEELKIDFEPQGARVLTA